MAFAGRTSLVRVRKYFPRVNRVTDARKRIEIHVTPKDGDMRGAKVKSPTQCAMARACVRLGADGAVIGLGTSYIVNGPKATRYRTPPTVAREIASFDRRSGFVPGTYTLTPPSASERMGVDHGGGRRSSHNTRGIRTQRDHVHTDVSFRRI